ncbi:hypothetical protein BS78_02G048500 [Paspalum vaginatum]|nr:hypothetical protein BS78_02G048500 [Paspalum vaginatum]
MASSRASSSRTLSLALVLAAAAALLLARPGAAQSPPAPAPSGGSRMTEIVSLYPCLGYMSGNNSASKPSASCCSALSSVVTSNPRCLCVVLGGGASSLGVTINNTRALQLPADCAVKTPPASECKSVGVPVTPSSPATPSAPSTSPQTPSVPSVTPPAAGQLIEKLQ